MASMLRTVIIDDDAGSRATLRRILAATPPVVVVGEFSDMGEASLELAARHPDVLIVEITEAKATRGRGMAAKTIDQLAKALPDTALIATGPRLSAEFVIEVIRAGALEFLSRPVEAPDLLAAVEKVARFRRGGAPVKKAGQITSVFSTKGGLGVTTVAINLVVCLAERTSGSTLLVELDARQSDIATFLDLRPTYSVLDALDNLERMDESFLRGLLVRHASGLWVLPGPSRIERVQLKADHVQAGLEIFRTHFDHVVLDLRHDVDPGCIAGLEASDTILFLTSLNVSALRSGAAGIAALRHLGLDLQRVRTVVMREDTGEDVTVKHARDTLGLPIYWKTPSDYAAVVTSINSGRPVVSAAPKSRIAKNLRQLADALPGGARSATEADASRAGALLRLVWNPKRIPGVG